MLATRVGVERPPDPHHAPCERCGRKRAVRSDRNTHYCVDCLHSDPEYHRIVALAERSRR